jgi:hypothetical protein
MISEKTQILHEAVRFTGPYVKYTIATAKTGVGKNLSFMIFDNQHHLTF